MPEPKPTDRLFTHLTTGRFVDQTATTMETHNEVKTLRQEDMTPEQQAWWLAFYRAGMQRKRETQAEMREYAKTPEYQESTRKLKEENAKRGTPFV